MSIRIKPKKRILITCLIFLLLQLVSCDLLNKDYRYIRLAKEESDLGNICNKQDLLYKKEFSFFNGEGEIFLVFKIKHLSEKELYSLLYSKHYKSSNNKTIEGYDWFREFYLKNNIKPKLNSSQCTSFYKWKIRETGRLDYSFNVVDITNKLLLIKISIP